MNAKAKHICNTYVDSGCRKRCPLSAACATVLDDSAEKFATRMDEAAGKIDLKGWD
jgi:hypothetical protein